jgi:Lon protease-like protein
MLKRCMETTKRFGICLPGLWQGDFAEYGTMVEITHYHPIPGETVDTAEGPLPRIMIETRGLYAFRVKNKAVDMSGYHLADVERVFDIEPEEEWAEISHQTSGLEPSTTVLDSKDLVGLVTKARSNVLSLLSPLDPVAKSHLEAEKGSLPDDLSDFTFWISDILPINPYQGYELLKLASVRSRLELICRWMDAAAANRSLPRT